MVVAEEPAPLSWRVTTIEIAHATDDRMGNSSAPPKPENPGRTTINTPTKPSDTGIKRGQGTTSRSNTVASKVTNSGEANTIAVASATGRIFRPHMNSSAEPTTD